MGVVVVDVRFCAPGWRCVSLQYRSTALLCASEHGHTDIVRMLLDRGASVDAINRVSQPVSPHASSSHRHPCMGRPGPGRCGSSVAWRGGLLRGLISEA